MIDIAANEGWLATALRLMQLVQMVIQGRWIHDSLLLTLPHVEHHHLPYFTSHSPPIDCLPELFAATEKTPSVLYTLLGRVMDRRQISGVMVCGLCGNVRGLLCGCGVCV